MATLSGLPGACVLRTHVKFDGRRRVSAAHSRTQKSLMLDVHDNRICLDGREWKVVRGDEGMSYARGGRVHCTFGAGGA